MQSLSRWASDSEEKQFSGLFDLDLKAIKTLAVEEAKQKIEEEKKKAVSSDKNTKKSSKQN